MTRRSYLENRLAKREQWAESASTKASQRFARADQISERFAGGQPILVGHHSERGARADQERIHNAMDKGIDLSNKAAHHSQAASGLARQLDHSIFSDDDNAIAALELRANQREAEADRMVAVNKAFKKNGGNLAALVTDGTITEAQEASILRNMRHDWRPKLTPHPAFEITNMRALVRTDRKRIDEIKQRVTMVAKAESAGGTLITRTNDGFSDYITVTFAEKPDRSIIDSLKAAGFSWSGGSWHGYCKTLPEGIEETVR